VDVNRALHHRESEAEKDDKDHGWTTTAAVINVDENESLQSSPIQKKRPMFRIRTKLQAQVGPISAGAVEGQSSPTSTFAPLSAIPEKTLTSATTASRQSTIAPPGAVTQHGRALSPEEAMGLVPLSKFGRRRALSYLNAITATDAQNPSLNAWQTMVNMDRASPVKTEPDQVPSFPLAESLFEPRPVTPVNTAESSVEEYYEAVLIATDGDFLDMSSVRSIFRENALQKSDAVLFEMPPVTEETLRQREEGLDTVVDGEGNTAFCCCF
jgi:hypothetical protein